MPFSWARHDLSSSVMYFQIAADYLDPITLPGHGQDVIRACGFGLEHRERPATEDVNAHQFATAPPLVDDPLGELERVEHGFVLRLADTAEAAVSTAVRVLVVDEDGYSLHGRP